MPIQNTRWSTLMGWFVILVVGLGLFGRDLSPLSYVLVALVGVLPMAMVMILTKEPPMRTADVIREMNAGR